MSTPVRRKRKLADQEVIRLNSLGFSLATISNILDCHPSLVTIRLAELGITRADTRRAFMEDIFASLDLSYQDKIAERLLTAAEGDPTTIKDYVKSLLVRDNTPILEIADV